MLLGLRTAIYPAPNLALAKAWYEQVVGAKPYFDEPFYVGFSVGGFELGLLPEATPGIAGPQPLWGVANAKAEFERLLAQRLCSTCPWHYRAKALHTWHCNRTSAQSATWLLVS